MSMIDFSKPGSDNAAELSEEEFKETLEKYSVSINCQLFEAWRKENQMSEKHCTDCVHYFASEDDIYAQCRRYPPKPRKERGRARGWQIFPEVAEHCYCGEFEPKDELD